MNEEQMIDDIDKAIKMRSEFKEILDEAKAELRRQHDENVQLKDKLKELKEFLEKAVENEDYVYVLQQALNIVDEE